MTRKDETPRPTEPAGEPAAAEQQPTSSRSEDREHRRPLPENLAEIDPHALSDAELNALEQQVREQFKRRGAKRLLDQIEGVHQRRAREKAQLSAQPHEDTATPRPLEVTEGETPVVSESAGGIAVDLPPSERVEPTSQLEASSATSVPASEETPPSPLPETFVMPAGPEEGEREKPLSPKPAEGSSETVEKRGAAYHYMIETAGDALLQEMLQTEYPILCTRKAEIVGGAEHMRSILTPGYERDQRRFRLTLEEARRRGLDISAYNERALLLESHEVVIPLAPPRFQETREQPEPTDKRTRSLERIDQALQGLSLRDRITLHHQQRALTKYAHALSAGEAHDEKELWRTLMVVFLTKAERHDRPGDALGLAESYREELRRGEQFPTPEENAKILDLVGRHAPEDALNLYQKITSTNEGAFAAAVGEHWFKSLQEEIRTTEQKDRQHPVNPIELGRLQAILDGAPIPETVNERIQTAFATLRLLRGEGGAGAASRERGEPRAQEAPPITTLSSLRSAYARGVRSQSRLLGRMSRRELEQHRTDYQATIETEVLNKVQTALQNTERGERDRSGSSATETTVRAAIVDALLTYRFEEETALRESMRSPSERTAASRFKQFWKQHAKARIAISVGLTGATMASAATGNILASGIFQSMKSLVAGTSATVATEGIWEQARTHFGDTKVLSRERVATLSDAEIERRIAAQSVACAAPEHGATGRTIKQKETMDLLLTEYRTRKEATMNDLAKKLQGAGRSSQEVIEALSLFSMDDEIALHHGYETREKQNRRNALKKWSTSFGTGLIVAGLTGGLGAARIARAVEAATAREAAEHTAQHTAGASEHLSTGSHSVPVQEAPSEPATPAAADIVPHPSERPAASDSLDADEGMASAPHDATSVDAHHEVPTTEQPPDSAASIEHQPAAAEPVSTPTPESATPPDSTSHGATEVQPPLHEAFDETPIQLSEKGQEALSAFRTTIHELSTSDGEVLAKLRQVIASQPASEALQRRMMEAFIDQQQGGTHEIAKEYAKALEKLFRALPDGALHENDTIGSVLNRCAGSLEKTPDIQ
ncbi:MAG: hypothetical protein V1778_02920 [bacterium]